MEQWLAALGPGLTKLSVLLFYKRIFVGKVFNITNWTLLVLSASWTIGGFFSNFRMIIMPKPFLAMVSDESSRLHSNTGKLGHRKCVKLL